MRKQMDEQELLVQKYEFIRKEDRFVEEEVQRMKEVIQQKMEENEGLKREIRDKQVQDMNVRQNDQLLQVKKQYREELDRAH